MLCTTNPLGHTTRRKAVYSTHLSAASPGNEALWNKSGARKVLISAIRGRVSLAGRVELEGLVNRNVITP